MEGKKAAGAMRDRIVEYAGRRYGAREEYLWERYPNYAVLRHGDNGKWFALFMDVPGSKLGLESGESVEILNVKMGDPLLADLLTRA